MPQKVTQETELEKKDFGLELRKLFRVETFYIDKPSMTGKTYWKGKIYELRHARWIKTPDEPRFRSERDGERWVRKTDC